MGTQTAAPSIDEPPLKRRGPAPKIPSSKATTVVEPDADNSLLNRALRVTPGDVRHPSAEKASSEAPPDVRTCTVEEDDSLNPLNWPTSKKIWITAQALLHAVMTGLNLGWCSSFTANSALPCQAHLVAFNFSWAMLSGFGLWH